MLIIQFAEPDLQKKLSFKNTSTKASTETKEMKDENEQENQYDTSEQSQTKKR